MCDVKPHESVRQNRHVGREAKDWNLHDARDMTNLYNIRNMQIVSNYAEAHWDFWDLVTVRNRCPATVTSPLP